MNETNKVKTPNELYREYQNNRDSIPHAVLNNLRDSAEQQKYEGNIHAILQQAKTVGVAADEHAKQINTAGTSPERAGFLDKLKDWFSPAMGGGLVAAALIAVVAVPLLRDQDQYQHLANCGNCLSHASNASALTRSTAPGQPRISTETRTAAKLGRISAALASSHETKAILEQLNLSTHARNPVFDASKALFIANVSARNAKINGLNEEAVNSIMRAATQFNTANSQTELQKNIANKLDATLEGLTDDASKLDTIIELTRRAMESLGV